ncbi:hypothetical protein AGR8A_pTi20022 [Agrobacterium fabrum str. J-07]|nr:hypothetical protein AGR8A_pTi20022 [Agrobacterium fabrum str. J-07]
MLSTCGLKSANFILLNVTPGALFSTVGEHSLSMSAWFGMALKPRSNDRSGRRGEPFRRVHFSP